jgi:hypothetical protein
VTVTHPGAAEWRVDQLKLGNFPFPRELIPRLLERAVGSRTSSLPIVIPKGIRDVAIHPGGVTLFGNPSRQ